MPPSPTRRHELIGRMTRDDAFIVAFWNLHKMYACRADTTKRHQNWKLCPLYVLRWGE